MKTIFHPLSHLWQSYRRYLETIEALIGTLRKEVPLSDEDLTRLLEKPELELEFDFSYEDDIENISVFPEVLRRSAFLSAFILLESQLENVCLYLEKLHKSLIKSNELRGSAISRASKYIKALHQYEISGQRQWAEIVRFQNIRNILVHSNGRISVEHLNQPIGKYIENSSLLELTHYGEARNNQEECILSVKKGFCEHAVSVIEDFFQEMPVMYLHPEQLNCSNPTIVEISIAQQGLAADSVASPLKPSVQ